MRKVRILYVVPVAMSKGPLGPRELERRCQALARWASPETEVGIVDNDDGPSSIESFYEEYVAIPGALRAVETAEREGWDAVVLGCFGDPGVEGMREIVSIPVVGPAEASMHIAAMLGHRFSVVTVLPSVLELIRRVALVNGLASRLASVRSADVPVLTVAEGDGESFRRTLATARAAVEEDGADTIVLGCMSMAFGDVPERLEAALKVPVLNPAQVALGTAELLVQSRLRHSRRAYPVPPKLEDAARGRHMSAADAL